MLIKLENSDYINPDRVDGITMRSGNSNTVAIVYYGGNKCFHITNKDLTKILEWHNKPAIPPAGLVEIKDDVSCENCKYQHEKASGIHCRDCKKFSNHIPADDI